MTVIQRHLHTHTHTYAHLRHERHAEVDAPRTLPLARLLHVDVYGQPSAEERRAGGRAVPDDITQRMLRTHAPNDVTQRMLHTHAPDDVTHYSIHSQDCTTEAVMSTVSQDRNNVQQ